MSQQPPPEWAAAAAEGLAAVAADARIHPTAQLIPADRTGHRRRIVIGPRCRIGAFAVLHGGTDLAADTEIGHGCVVGEPETGYALRAYHRGEGAATRIGTGAVLRAGAVAYAGVEIGPRTTVGHHTLLRTGVAIGADSQLGHHLTVERGVRIGAGVRCSPGSHLTADMHIGDGAFVGAGVRTINDKRLIWRDPARQQPLAPPRIDTGAKVGTGAILLAGVVIGARALVGAGSVVTRDVAADTVVYGGPARARNGGTP
ncbi:LbetaH domain-containing protein [Glycomyces xiaoerkulensis]|uniref:DapH/DapD/GlmU-related protein n=1 Tax=Glycomyces xiaoerkulensis TaxID=2038139 RepID=UPI000C25A093|nr:DapH/DapD/GlmU-related protein [Glycomyces xiaoerkulensis]